MKPASSDEPVRPWERVQPRPVADRRTRETFLPKAPTPAEEVLALHDEELDGKEAEPKSTASDTVICF